jgi:hypothetical protein
MIRTSRKVRFFVLITAHVVLISFAFIFSALAIGTALFPSVPVVLVWAGAVILLLCAHRPVERLTLFVALAVDAFLEARR